MFSTEKKWENVFSVPANPVLLDYYRRLFDQGTYILLSSGLTHFSSLTHKKATSCCRLSKYVDRKHKRQTYALILLRLRTFYGDEKKWVRPDNKKKCSGLP